MIQSIKHLGSNNGSYINGRSKNKISKGYKIIGEWNKLRGRYYDV